MIDMAILGVIRRWALRENMSIREIARRTGLASNTVKKYLAAGGRAPRCQTGEPEQARSVRQDALNVAPNGGHEVAKIAAQSSADSPPPSLWSLLAQVDPAGVRWHGWQHDTS